MRDLVSLACGGEEAASRKKILRPHQAASLDMLRSSLGRGNRRVVLQAPTGFGKTVVSAAIMEGALRKGRSVLFTVPRIALVDQAVAECEGQGIDSIGVIQANHPRTDRYARVQVASVDTLARRDLPEKPGVVIVDECHFGSRVIPQLMEAWPDVHFIGMSATPWARGMGLIWQDLVVAATTASLIEAGFLSRFVVFAPDVPDLAGVKVARGDYTEQGLAEVMGDRKLVGHIAQTWLERGEDRPTLAFGVNCAHARQIAAEFDRAGVATAYCDAFTDRVERQHIERQFRAGDVRVVCSVRTLTTGVDWPVSCIIDAAPTQSEMLHVQRIGRGLRINPGSEECVVLDHAGNSLRLGLVTDIHHETLDATEPGARQAKKAPEKLPKPCAACGVLHTGRVCPACGMERKPGSGLETVDGDLVEVTGAKVPTMQDKQRFWSMALALDAKRGRGGRLAKGLYRGKFGVWPRGLADRHLPPDGAFLRYEHSRRIAYAKKMEAGR